MRILFVCSGNTCRSPMAHMYLADLMKKLNRTDVEVASAGTAAFPGDEISRGAANALATDGIEASGFRSSRVSGESVETADIILAFTESHRRQLLHAFPQVHAKVRLIGEYVNGRDVSDPFGGDDDVYLQTYRVIKSAVDNLVATDLQK
ncbi:MAG: low molecular weight protein arginine phosphatase [Victivallaceae bacterium]|nr:low molecular weight protein arginine phosphatase [Victivallaceae bacterium]